MKRPELYRKKDNGRYEKYEPKLFADDTLYRRGSDGKYYATSMLTTRDLDEGVWVVKREHFSMAVTASDYMRTQYHLEHVADLENPLMQLNTAKLGYVDKIINDVMYSDKYNTRFATDKFKLQVADIIYQLTGEKI